MGDGTSGHMFGEDLTWTRTTVATAGADGFPATRRGMGARKVAGPNPAADPAGTVAGHGLMCGTRLLPTVPDLARGRPGPGVDTWGYLPRETIVRC